MGVIINKDASGDLRVAYPFNPVYLRKIKTLPGRKWHPDGQYWTFPYSGQVLNQIISAFAGEELDIDPALRTLLPQVQREKQARDSRPLEPPPGNPLLDRVRDLIRLKHYSIRTEKSYLPWVQRYLLFHNNRDPRQMGGQEIEAFLSHLAVNLKVSSSTEPGLQRPPVSL